MPKQLAFDYDLIIIGLGPAGTAAACLADSFGLRACAVEKQWRGGTSLNAGCIPSKALLRLAKLSRLGVPTARAHAAPSDSPHNAFRHVRESIAPLREQNRAPVFQNGEVLLRHGPAYFIDPHTVAVGEQRIRGRKIIIASGSLAHIPDIPGLHDVGYLTNHTVFDLDLIPESMLILGGGTESCEMAQALARLGTTCSIINPDDQLLPHADPQASDLLQKRFIKEGIAVYNDQHVSKLMRRENVITAQTYKGVTLNATHLLVAAGRSPALGELQLKNGGIAATDRGITVTRFLQTSQPHIYAAGDCNGLALYAHAAMHQGRLAVMNCLTPWQLFRKSVHRSVVPWAIFTDPEIAAVGMTEREIQRRDLEYATHIARYEDFSAAISQHTGPGFIKLFSGERGRILGVTVAGENAGELINEWTLAIQHRLTLFDIWNTNHCFPTMGSLSQRVAEQWMLTHAQSPRRQKSAQRLFRW